MNDVFYRQASSILDNMSSADLFNSLKAAGFDVAWKIVPSRNKREGRYSGCVKGHHLRWDYPHNVSSWLAFRLYSERKYK